MIWKIAKFFSDLQSAYLAPWAWHIVGTNGKTYYEQNSITGERRAWQRSGGYQPLNQDWLSGKSDDIFR